jgi:hypothetical protein
MSIYIQKHFHFSQATVPRDTKHPSHHRPLALFLVFLIIAQQAGVLVSAASSIPFAQGSYVYIQTNSVIDDSWIGTPVFSGASSRRSLTTPKQANTTPNQVITTPKQVRLTPPPPSFMIDDSWIGDFTKQKPRTSVSPKKPETSNNDSTNGIYNSVPSNTNNTINWILPSPANYITPNGTSYYNIPGNTGPQNSSVT